MRAKPDLDAAGIVWLTAFSALMGFNQVLVKVMNGALQPVFNAGLRSLLALGLLGVWIVLMRKTWRIAPSARPWAILVGAFFAGEFICLFVALDLTSVARASVMFYTMPVWLTLMAHVAVPGERLSTTKVIGQALALAGVVWALFDRDTGSQGSVTGDLLALGGAVGWAAIALLTKVSPFARETPEAQLGWQLVVSATILLPVCLLFGPLVRDFTPIYGVGVAVQTAIVAGAFLGWFGLMKIYPASSVASFAFLAPVFGVVSGWLILGEEISVAVWGALILVALGLILINRPARR